MYNRIIKYVEIEIYRDREIFFQGRSQESKPFLVCRSWSRCHTWSRSRSLNRSRKIYFLDCKVMSLTKPFHLNSSM